MLNLRRSFPLALAISALLVAPAAAQQRHRGRAPKPEQQKPLPEPEKRFPYDAVWSLREINGKPTNADATLMIDQNNHGTGASGCNTWSSPMLPVAGQRIAMGAVAMTRRSCPPAAMAFERTYLSVLHAGPTWDLVGSELVLKVANMTLRFSRNL